ncbi:MAG: type II toxin-antitoxin system RelE/ParE family toxin [Thermodesulfobacteriota bacterium]
MIKWKIKIFLPLSGKDIFDEWIVSQSPEAEERIRGMIRLLSVSPIEMWSRPFFAHMHGHRHICEIIVKYNKKQYRPLGCFGPVPQTYTILVGATKKVNTWTPHDALKTAEKRRQLVFNDRRYLGDYKP